MTWTTPPAPVAAGGHNVRNVGILIVVLVLVGLAQQQGEPKTPAMSDSAVKAAMVENIGDFGESTATLRQNPDGSPDIAFKGGVLIIVTMDPATADALCRVVAAITNDPATSEPLGVRLVAVISGGQKVAECRP